MHPPPHSPLLVDRPAVEGRPQAVPGADVHAPGCAGSGIRCPLCGWTPSDSDRWMCRCRHSWNTFETGGVCPNCLHQWADTQCLACHRWSRHSDWYPKD